LSDSRKISKGLDADAVGCWGGAADPFAVAIKLLGVTAPVPPHKRDDAAAPMVLALELTVPTVSDILDARPLPAAATPLSEK